MPPPGDQRQIRCSARKRWPATLKEKRRGNWARYSGPLLSLKFGTTRFRCRSDTGGTAMF
eukprot:5835067-Prorocentrum_lima.AAC.1